MKKKDFLIVLVILVNITAIGVFYFRYVSSTAPIIGGDFRYFIPRLLDNYLYQRINGFFSVNWYTPSFAGGEPVYANPQDVQFSLPQLLVWFFNPWQALRISTAFYVVAGFVAFYFFFTRILDFNPFAAILGSIFSTVNGFHIEHQVAGHVTFQVFPLFGLVMIILFSPKIPRWLGGVFLSLICTLFLYSGSFQIISYYLLTLVIFLPVLYLLKPSLFALRHIMASLLWGGGFSILAGGSKLYAIYSLMKFSPRIAADQYDMTWLQGIRRIVVQLIGPMTAVPINAWIQRSSLRRSAEEFANYLVNISHSPYSFAGLDIGLTPALLLVLAGGLISIFFWKPVWKTLFTRKRLIAWICLVLGIFFVIEFTLARGQPYEFLHSLPIMSSLRANVRYVSAFIFPLALVGAAVFHRWTRNWRSTFGVLSLFFLFNVIALTPMWTYYQIPPEYQLRLFDIRLVDQVYPRIRYHNETFPVKYVVPEANTWEVFELNATDLIDPYEPLFKSYSERFHDTLHAGSVSEIDSGFYNIMNPTGYVYPEANKTKPFDRIAVSDSDNFQAFINRRPTTWKQPLLQRILNWIALITICSEFVILLVCLVQRAHRFFVFDRRQVTK